MKAETCRDHREHEIKHIILIVANEGFILLFNIVACLLRARNLKPADSRRWGTAVKTHPLLGNG
jgi:hypothetical protein